MKNFIALLILLISLDLHSQTNWTWQNPSHASNYLYSIQALNDNNLFAAGAGGTILKSTNGGQTFSIYPTGINTDLRGLHFPDMNTGFTTGAGGRIYKTTNSGLNWSLLTSGVTTIINSVYFRNTNTGWAVTSNGICLRTTNGGNNWASSVVTSNELRSIYFTDDNTGYAAGGQSGVSALFKTTNGGINWNALSTSAAGFLYSVYFVNNNTGWAAGQNQIILKTTDSGQNWVQQNTGTGTLWFWSVRFLNENTGWASGSDKIFKTTDGGGSWNPIQVFNPNASINFTSLSTSTSYLYSAGTSGMVVKSSNAGENWNALQSGPTINFSSIQFLNSSTGYVSGFLGLIGPASIYKTTSGGANWFQQTIPSVQNLYDVNFIDTETGFVCGRGSKILITTNGGVNWNLSFSGATATELLYSGTFSDNDNAYAVGGYFSSLYYGLMFKTTNRGANWSKVTLTDSLGLFYSINFANSQNGYACGTGGKITKTTDGGNTWINLTSGVTTDLRSVYFINTNTGWISGASGVIKKTTNGGINWASQNSGSPTANLTSILFSDENNGRASGNLGVFKTTNGGLNWTPDFIQTANPINSINFINNNTGWIAGDYGTIMRTDNGVTSIEQNNEISIDYRIKSINYPNPFNPTTKIKFYLPTMAGSKTKITIKIFDIMGKEITTLYNNYLMNGTYEFEWNAINNPSGIYFYRIESTDFKDFGRMVLLK